MAPERAPHTLLRIAGPQILSDSGVAPPWVSDSIERAPWVVIRRAEGRPGLIPVGVRGAHRAERFAAWIDAGLSLEAVTPRDLVRRRAWHSLSRRDEILALAALEPLEVLMNRHGLADAWGPTGSVGFELASGSATASGTSDLDLAIWTAGPLAIDLARSLLAALETLAVRSDVLLETPCGALALAEYARGDRRVLLRTAAGPRLVERAEVCWEHREIVRPGASVAA